MRGATVAHGTAGSSRPFPAYRGDEPYVFVCYSHHDTDAVYSDMQCLRGLGLRIWYDEGISPGTEWSEELARALEGASLVLFYATGASSTSRHCRDEINFAHNRDKIILPVYLEDVKLPSGLELSLSSTQAVHRHRMDDDHYLDKLRDVLPPDTLGDDAAVPTPEATSATTALAASTAKRGGRSLAIAALVVIALAGLVWMNRAELTARWIMFAAENLGNPIEQQIGFAQAADGTRIAYGITGEGPPILIVLGWATHLQQGFTSPAYDTEGVLALTSEEHRVIRYDGRGFGLSDRNIDDFSLEARVSDIEAVVEAAGLDRFALYVMSAGGPAGIAYALRHPEKITSLVLAGSSVSTEGVTRLQMDTVYQMLDVVETTWPSPAAIDLLTEMFFPDADPTLKAVFREFLTRSTSGRDLAGFFRVHLKLDVSELAEQIELPTLVIHAEDDTTIPLERGRRMASLIPGARFEIVPGGHNAGTGMTLEPRRIILDFIDEQYAKDTAATEAMASGQ